MDRKIEEIMRRMGITGDIGFDEDDEHFWKRKFIELDEKWQEKVKL